MVEPTELESWRLLRQLAIENAEQTPKLEAGGGGPHDPGMEQRVAALEAGQQRLELSAARIEAVLSTLATKADVARIEGVANVLDSKITALDGRVSRVETLVGSALTMAVGKAIGPAQFIAMLAGAVGLFGAAIAAYRWLNHQAWFGA